MKVVLNQDVKGLGKKLQTVEVSEGYARNFLLPKKLANMLDNKTKNDAINKINAIEYKKDTEMKKSLEIKEIIEKKYIEFKHKVGESGRLFGSVTEKEIAEEIKKIFNVNIDKKKIKLNEQIKVVGSYTAVIKLYEGIFANVKVNVVKLS